MFAQESVMDLQKEREAFEKECRLLCYKGNMVMSNLGSFYNNEQTNWMWQMWLSAKAQAVPEGFVLAPVKEIKTWYLDDVESIYREDPDWLCDISIGEVVEVEHRVSYELDQDPVFAAIQWDEENGDVGYYETFKSKAEAEKVAAHCKAMVEAQEPTND